MSFEVWRNEYLQLERTLRLKGLDPAAIKITCDDLSTWRDGIWALKPDAYMPTGVALGCPLPDPVFAKFLNRVIRLVDDWICLHEALAESSLSIVPASSYHITILNRSHYEYSSITALDTEEHQRISQLVRNLGIGQIELFPIGFVLTASGRLLVKCLPPNDRIGCLRQTLSEAFPVLRINMPRIVHIKIAHLRLPLSDANLSGLIAYLKHLDGYIIHRIEFGELYTPQGHIPL